MIKGILLTVIVLFALHYFVGIDVNKVLTQTGDSVASAWKSIQNTFTK